MNTVVQRSHEVARIGTWKVDLKTSEVHWDEIVYEIHGINPGTPILLENAISFYHPDYRDLVAKEVEKGIQEQQTWDFEAIIINSKGENIWVRALGFPLVENGETIGLKGSFIDISDQKRTALRMEQYKNAVDRMPIGFLMLEMLDIDDIYSFKIIDANKASETATGVHRNEILGELLVDAFPALKGVPEWLETYQQVVIEQKSKNLGNVEYGDDRVKKSIFRLSAHPLKEHKLYLFYDNITDQVQLTEAINTLNKELEQKVQQRTLDLKISNSALRQQLNILEHATVVSIANTEGKIIEVNDQFVEISGYSREEILGNNHNILKSDQHDSKFYKDLWDTISAGKIWKGEFCNKNKNGEFYWLSSSIFPFTNIQGEIEKYFNICFDITSIKEHELQIEQQREELKERNKELEYLNQELETFSYSVSHDLKAPLRAISGFSSNLSSTYKEQLDETAQRWLDYINVNSKRMDDLINDILSFSRLGRLEMDKVEIQPKTEIEIMIKDIAQSHGKDVEYNIADLPTVETDRTIFALIWQNLIQNSIKYAKEGDKCIISIDYKEDEKYHTFEIKDNGIGFDMKYYDKIFGIFQRLHDNSTYEGTGVGLANTKRAVDKLGGKIWADSEPDKGATFTFTILK